jgi:hypothetical protein
MAKKNTSKAASPVTNLETSPGLEHAELPVTDAGDAIIDSVDDEAPGAAGEDASEESTATDDTLISDASNEDEKINTEETNDSIYVVQWDLKRNGRRYSEGDEITLTVDDAASIGACIRLK